MASTSFVESLLGNLNADLRKAFKDVFTYVLKDLRFGRAGDGMRAENFSGHFYQGMTSAVSGQEFVIPHQLERAPYLAIPALDLQRVGSEVVGLQVTRAADARNVYLASAEENVPFSLYLEG